MAKKTNAPTIQHKALPGFEKALTSTRVNITERARLKQKSQSSITMQSGSMGTIVTSGYVEAPELNVKLSDIRIRQREYSEMIANVEIISGSVKWFQALVGQTNWSFEPADDTPQAQEIADFYAQAFLRDCEQPFDVINEQMALAYFYGFSIHEHSFRVRDDGLITIDQIIPRPQKTIDRFDVDRTGRFYGVIQQDENEQNYIYLDKDDIIYIADKSLTDAPDGLGALRLVHSVSLRYRYYWKLYTGATEDDMRGIIKARYPQAILNQLIDDADPEATDPETGMTEREAAQAKVDDNMAVIRDATGQTDVKKSPNKRVGFALPSDVYIHEDETSTKPTPIYLYDIEMVTGPAQGHEQLLKSLDKMEMNMATALGTGALLVGTTDVGTYSTIESKSSQFGLAIDRQLKMHAQAFRKGLMRKLARLNGIPEALIPDIVPERIKTRELEATAKVFQTLAMAGIPLTPSDPAVNYLRTEAGGPPMRQEDIDKIEIEEEELRQAKLEAMKPDPTPPTSSGE